MVFRVHEAESYFPVTLKQVLKMDPGQQSSSPKPFSDEETQLFYNIRDSMDETFRLANEVGKVGLWQEVSRRLEAFNHHRSPQELEAKFGQYRPKRPRKEGKRAVPANEQEQDQCSTPQQDWQQQAQDRLARSQRVEAERKKLVEKIDLNAFFSERNSWENVVTSSRLGVSTRTDTGDNTGDNTVGTSNRPQRSRRAHKPNSWVTGPEWWS